MAASIQFINKDSVINAYNDRAVECWSISQGKQFMFKGCGNDELINILDILGSGATNAIYTLKVYEDFEDKKQIKSNSPDDGSFNFRLNAPDMLLTQSQMGSLPYREEFARKIAALEEELEEYKNADNSGGLGRLGEIMNHPAIIPLIPVLMEKVLSFLGTPAPGTVPAVPGNLAISGVENQTLQEIVNLLLKYDPDLKKHLQKLLELAINNPAQFKQLIQMFN